MDFELVAKDGYCDARAGMISTDHGQIETPKYAIVERARISLRPQGTRVFYPAWSAKALSGPTSIIIESP